MYILGLSLTEIIFTIFVLIVLLVSIIGLRVRREQLSKGIVQTKRDVIEKRSEVKRLKQEEDELAALMFDPDVSYDD